MKFAVVVLMTISITGCNSTPGSNKEEVSIGCINHANAISTDAELGMMRTGYANVSESLLTMDNCRYYYFNPDAKTDTSELLTTKNKEQCEIYRARFHAAAVQLKQEALSICLRMR